MLKQNIKRNGYWMLIRSRLRLRKIMSALALGFLLGVCVSQLLAMKKVMATGDEGPTLMLTSVSQYGEPIDPVWSDLIYDYHNYEGWGDYYYPVANNGDKVTVCARVDGLADGQEYRIDYDRIITSENNGEELCYDVKPYADMRDSAIYDEHGEIEDVSMIDNEYFAELSLVDAESYSYYDGVKVLVRPATVGNSNMEIMSIKQDGVELNLDLVGRQAQDYYKDQTINEYQLPNITKPVEITIKMKNLIVGAHYSVSFSDGQSSYFTAETTEFTGTGEFYLDFTEKHNALKVYVYEYAAGGDSRDSSFDINFNTIDPNFVPFGNIVINGVSQGGEPIAPTVTEESWAPYYTFRVNDVQDVAVNLSVSSAMDEANYYVGYNLNPTNYSSYHPVTWRRFTGAELKNGVTVYFAPMLNDSNNSPFQANFFVAPTENSYNTFPIYYNEYNSEHGNGDYFYFDFFEDENLPRYTVAYGYANYPDIPEDAFLGEIDARYHNKDNPLKVRIEGTRYVNDTVYGIKVTVRRGGEEYFTGTYAATGAELNSIGGKTIVLSGLTLRAPDFDLDSNDPYIWSQLDSIGYDFNVEVNGLSQESRGGFYRYKGRVDTIITYPGGGVNATPGRNGMGAVPYISFSMANVSSETLSEESGAILHYLGSDFDDESSYEYALYYNGATSDYDSVAGRKIREGTISGRELNTHALSTPLLAPEGETDGVWYNLVIRKDGDTVTLSRCRLDLSEGPRIETFKINNNDDVYTQTGSTFYTVAKNTDISATVKGLGFNNDDSVLLKVEINGYNWDDEAGYGDWEQLNDLYFSTRKSGLELNNGYTFTVPYDSRFVSYDNVEIYIYFPENDGYILGHAAYVNYVDAERLSEVEGGFHIDEDGSIEFDEIVEPGGDEVNIDNITGAIANTSVEHGVLTVTADKACVAIGVKNGIYTLLEATGGSDGEGNTKTRTFNVSSFDEVKVALKGDGDMDGMISSSDANLINRSLISPTLGKRYRALTDLEKALFDLDGDGVISSGDVNIINKSLISPTLRPYKAIQW